MGYVAYHVPGTRKTCGSVPQAGPSSGQSLLHISLLGQTRMPGQVQPASQPCFLPAPLVIVPVSLGVRSCPLPVGLLKGPVWDSWLQSGPGKQVERWALVQDPPTAPAHLVMRSPPRGKGVYTQPQAQGGSQAFGAGTICWHGQFVKGKILLTEGRVTPEKLREQHAPAAAGSAMVSLQGETRSYLMRGCSLR